MGEPRHRATRADHLIVLLFLSATTGTQVPIRAADEGLRMYHNERWGFCLTYPSDWALQEGFNKAGIRLSGPGLKPVGSISIGALPDQPRGGNVNDNLDDDTPMTLTDNVQNYIRRLGAPNSAGFELMENTAGSFRGASAAFTTVKLPGRGGAIIEKTIWILSRGALFSLVLKCPSSDLSRLEPTFKKVTDSFVFQCSAAR
jgi:hypothetical protein